MLLLISMIEIITISKVSNSIIVISLTPVSEGRIEPPTVMQHPGQLCALRTRLPCFLLYHRCLNLSNFKIRSNTNVLLRYTSFRLLFRRILRNFFPRAAGENYCTFGALQISCCCRPCNKRPENRSRLLFPLN